METFQPEEIVVESGSEGSLVYRNLRAALPQVPFRIVEAQGQSPWDGILSEPAAGGPGASRRVEDGADLNGNNDPAPDHFGSAKKKLYLARHKGEFIKKCPGSDGQVCCNYFVINFASNCPMDCSYCYLQDYLAQNAALKVFSNIDDLITEADRLLSRHRQFFFRIGTGEITDSLALEPYIGFAREIVPYFAEQGNVLLELKTKSDCVDGLLDVDPKERVVVSWSMNPQRVIDRDEHGTASLAERLEAARRCQEAGYRLGFHFDPMIEYPGWELDYQAMVERTFATIDWRRVSWLSLGVLRNTPGLKRTMRERFPRTELLTGEQVLCPDGKFRYFQPLRIQMYRKMAGWIRQAAPTAKIYLCMESKEVWQQVFGYAPGCEKELGEALGGRL